VAHREVVSFRIRLVSLVVPAPPLILVSILLLPVSWVMAVESADPMRSSAVPLSRDLHAASDRAIREPRMNVDERFMVSLSSAAPHRHHHKS
jgi:hypothetical protein